MTLHRTWRCNLNVDLVQYGHVLIENLRKQTLQDQ